MELALTIILLVVCVFLTAVITAQTDRGEGISGAVAGQSSSFAAKNKKFSRDGLLKKATIIGSILFAVLVIAVNMIGFFG